MKLRPCWLTNPVGVKLSSYLNTTFCSNKYRALLIDVLNNFDNFESIAATFTPGGYTHFYGLYRYVQLQGVWFLWRFGHKLDIDLAILI